MSSIQEAKQLYQAGKFFDCKKMLEPIVETNPTPESLELLGYTYDQIGHLRSHDQKEDYFQKSMKLFNQLRELGAAAESEKGIATVLLHAGKAQEATEHYKKALALSNDPNLYLSIGNAQRHNGNLSAALSSYEQYRSQEGDDWNVLSNISMVHEEMGNISEAREFAKKALKGFPLSEHPEMKELKKTLKAIAD
jgi:tetratricopeptide (TPR) repeat protein